jgi:uncharacterized protein (TIGR02452 family)
MPDREQELGKNARSKSPVQTTLPATFNLSRKRNTSTDSPYFSKSETSQQKIDEKAAPSAPQPKINLYASRRAPSASHQKPRIPNTRSSTLLSHVAAETKSLLPNLVLTTPHAPPTAKLYTPENLPCLDPAACPKLASTTIKVVNADSIDAALGVSATSRTDNPNDSTEAKPVLVLNMANAHHPGGGWLHGALAQEEVLCYRSSLSFTLKRRLYPIPDYGGIYSPTVVIIRESLARGHDVLDLSKPEELPVLSFVSVAAIRGPAIAKTLAGAEKYKHAGDRDVMKEKMRVVLRIAAATGHRRLVLGALGCGAFGNPRVEVARCWREVFEEQEFQGGWWETVVFAVMEEGGKRDGDGNFGVFWRDLNGAEV